jgi:hypothetical protein
MAQLRDKWGRFLAAQPRDKLGRFKKRPRVAKPKRDERGRFLPKAKPKRVERGRFLPKLEPKKKPRKQSALKPFRKDKQGRWLDPRYKVAELPGQKPSKPLGYSFRAEVLCAAGWGFISNPPLGDDKEMHLQIWRTPVVANQETAQLQLDVLFHEASLVGDVGTDYIINKVRLISYYKRSDDNYYYKETRQ